MKRSEMVSLIANYFYESNVEPQDADRLGDKLLAEMEAKGMLPPPTTLKELQMQDNAWEPETSNRD